jgi:hypothetical protein
MMMSVAQITQLRMLGLYCLLPLEQWDRGVESHWGYGCRAYVCVALCSCDLEADLLTSKIPLSISKISNPKNGGP